MSALPEVEKFKEHKLEFCQTHTFTKPSATSEIDLEQYHRNLIAAKNKQLKLVQNGSKEVNPIDLLYELFSKKFLESFECATFPLFDKHIGYSKKHQSLCISLIDVGIVKTIAIRHSYDENGNLIKWKTYGSKTYIPYKIKDEYVFFGVGMAELILFEMMQVSYILLQSDSVYRHISKEIIAQMHGKNIIILKENDASFEKLIVELRQIFIGSNIFFIDFKKVLQKPLPRGYDYRDFCNEIGDINIVEEKLEQELLRQIKDRR